MWIGEGGRVLDSNVLIFVGKSSSYPPIAKSQIKKKKKKSCIFPPLCYIFLTLFSTRYTPLLLCPVLGYSVYRRHIVEKAQQRTVEMSEELEHVSCVGRLGELSFLCQSVFYSVFLENMTARDLGRHVLSFMKNG